jgi:hypothetical protein
MSEEQWEEQMKIITEWEGFLAKIRPNMCLELKDILEKSINNKNIYAMFFEYELDYMDIVFYAVDEKENVILKKIPVLNNEISCKHLFLDNLMEKQIQINDYYKLEYEYEQECEHDYDYDYYYNDFYEISNAFYEAKEEIFANWFIECWDKIRCEYNNIPKTYFSKHDTNCIIINLD